MKIIWHIILSILIFSLWAGFALLIVNPLYRDDLAGYVIGTICVWEYVAMGVAIGISFLLIRKWGYPEIQNQDGQSTLVMNSKYGIAFFTYLLIAICTGIWQFWIFSQTF